MRTFNVPITHPYIQNLTEEDIDFIEQSLAFDKPGVLDRYLNTVHDDEFEEYWEQAMTEKKDGTEDVEDAENTPTPPREHLESTIHPMPEEFINMPKKASENASKTPSEFNTKVDDWEEVD